MKRRAFTLVELLVVVAVIAILAAILFPVFAKAREKARQSTCQSNLKQIGSAFGMYRSDWDENMPGVHNVNEVSDTCDFVMIRNGYRGWISQALFTYVKNKQIWSCPSDGRDRQDRRPGLSPWNDLGYCGPINSADYNRYIDRLFHVSYAYNYMGVGNDQDLTGNLMPGMNRRDANCERPGEMAIMWDSVNRWVDWNGGFWQNASGSDKRDIPQYMNRNFDYGHWHNEQANFLFYDGHVKTDRFGTMKYQNFFNLTERDPRMNRPITAVPFPTP